MGEIMIMKVIAYEKLITPSIPLCFKTCSRLCADSIVTVSRDYSVIGGKWPHITGGIRPHQFTSVFSNCSFKWINMTLHKQGIKYIH